MMIELILLFPFYVLSHRCIHEEIQQVTPSFLTTIPPMQDKRSLQTSIAHPIQILVDSSNLRSADSDAKIFIEKTVMSEVSKKLSRLLMIQGGSPELIPGFSSTPCNIIVPQQYSLRSTNADLIIFLTSTFEQSDFLAFASSCVLSRSTNRPIIGFVSINLYKINWSNISINDWTFAVLHEMFHILAFSPSLFRFFPSRLASSNNQIITPKLVSYAQFHFSCPNMFGVPLENEGDSRSAMAHFEKRVFGNELMTSQLTAAPSLSHFTLKLMEDSGWYIPNYSLAEPLTWGKDRGCSFLSNSCPSSREMCGQAGAVECSVDFLNKVRCQKTGFSDGCLIREVNRGLVCSQPGLFSSTLHLDLEAPGEGAKCFYARWLGKRSATCLRASCSSSGQLSVSVFDTSFSCLAEGQVVTNQGVQVECPNPALFCRETNSPCPNACSGKGLCKVGGTCECFSFWEGSDCSVFRGCGGENSPICSKLLASPRNVFDSSVSTKNWQSWRTGIRLIIPLFVLLIASF